MRKLQLTKAGKWYVVLTIALGVVAVNSGNNVIYLLESLLLSGMIYSGILSEKAISSLELNREIISCCAGDPTLDNLIVKNKSTLAFYCLEIGEWRDGKFISLAFLPRIDSNETLILRSQQVIPARGPYHWDGIAIATSAPFGFARKIRIIARKDKRTVWPTKNHSPSAPLVHKQLQKNVISTEFAEGEIREIQAWEDSKLIHWPLSVKGDRYFGRVRNQSEQNTEITLNCDLSNELEIEIQKAAANFYKKPKGAQNLTLIYKGNKRRYLGRQQSLNQLAMVGYD